MRIGFREDSDPDVLAARDGITEDAHFIEALAVAEVTTPQYKPIYAAIRSFYHTRMQNHIISLMEASKREGIHQGYEWGLAAKKEVEDMK